MIVFVVVFMFGEVEYVFICLDSLVIFDFLYLLLFVVDNIEGVLDMLLLLVVEVVSIFF